MNERATHENSLLAYLEGKEGQFSKRQDEILRILAIMPQATDRQLLELTHYSDLNAIRPRVTELVQLGALEEVGSTKCLVTGKRVRLVGRAQRQTQFL